VTKTTYIGKMGPFLFLYISLSKATLASLQHSTALCNHHPYRACEHARYFHNSHQLDLWSRCKVAKISSTFTPSTAFSRGDEVDGDMEAFSEHQRSHRAQASRPYFAIEHFRSCLIPAVGIQLLHRNQSIVASQRVMHPADLAIQSIIATGASGSALDYGRLLLITENGFLRQASIRIDHWTAMRHFKVNVRMPCLTPSSSPQYDHHKSRFSYSPTVHLTQDALFTRTFVILKLPWFAFVLLRDRMIWL
jgi:hypothetical protein